MLKKIIMFVTPNIGWKDTPLKEILKENLIFQS